MRIAMVSSMEGVPWGGSEELWSQAALHLASQGHQVFVSVKGFSSVPRRIQQLQESGIPVHFRSRNPKSFVNRLLDDLTASIAWRRQRWERRRWLRSVRPDFVCVSDGAISGGLSWMQDCEYLHIPHVSIGQANNEGWWPSDREAAALRSSFAKAKQCFFVSRANQALFEDQISMRLPNAQVVWNPFNVPWDTAQVWPGLDTTDNMWSLACVARISPSAKGQDILVRTLALPHWRERNLRVDFVGKGEWEVGLRSMVDEAKLSHKFRFLGQVDNMVPIWETHHALILASRFEGLPLAVVEAMLCYRPVIATAVAGTPEVVVDGMTGYLASAPTVPLLDAALQRAWDQRDRWMEIGAAAGSEIRKQIPRDPGKLFASILEQLFKA
jgi:glycosyltransferase involved in cell wall biosynthesis